MFEACRFDPVDPRVRLAIALHRHDVLIPPSPGWVAAAPTETLAPMPLTDGLLRNLYKTIGLSTFHIALLCGVGIGTVKSGLAAAGITTRGASEACPWMIRTYALPAAKAKPSIDSPHG